MKQVDNWSREWPSKHLMPERTILSARCYIFYWGNSPPSSTQTQDVRPRPKRGSTFRRLIEARSHSKKRYEFAHSPQETASTDKPAQHDRDSRDSLFERDLWPSTNHVLFSWCDQFEETIWWFLGSCYVKNRVADQKDDAGA